MGRRAETLERDLETYWLRSIRRAGAETWKWVPVETGMPDRVVLHQGNVYLVELKTDVGTPSVKQRVWAARAARLGVTVHLLHGVEEIDAWINTYLKGAPCSTPS